MPETRSRLRRPGVLTFLRWEWALQSRTLRFRLCVAFYLLIVPVPAMVLFVGGERVFGSTPGSVSYLVWTQLVQTLVSVVLGCALAGNRNGRRDREEMWPVLSASPLSNAGYGLRRSAAIALMLAPITALGTAVAAGLAVAAGVAPTSPTHWLTIWFLMIFLPAAASATAWRTLVSASGSEMLAAILALVLMNGTGVIAHRIREASGLSIGVSGELFGFVGFQWVTYLVGQLSDGGRVWIESIASEAPFDFATALRQWWLIHSVSLGLILAVGLSVPLWLGRTRRDLPPLRLADDHWGRSLGPKLYSFLQRLVPDAGLRELRWLPFLVLAAALVPIWSHLHRGLWALDRAGERFRAEQSGAEQPVTDPSLVMAKWRAEGAVSRERADLSWRADFWLSDAAPDLASEAEAESDGLRLSFTLDPELEVEDLEISRVEASSPEGSSPPEDRGAGSGVLDVTETTRTWDRWLIEITPRPRAGERFRLSARLRGRAGRMHFWRTDSSASFSALYDEYLRRGRAWRRTDLAYGHFQPGVTNREIELRVEMLGPVPRYSTWELTPKPVIPGEPGWNVPDEASSTASQLELDLTFEPGPTLEDRLAPSLTAPGLSVASSCGGLSEEAAPGEPLRLIDTCRMPAHELRIFGGRWLRLGEEPVLAAALPGHREKIESMLPELRQAVAASSEAWPGFAGIDRMVVLESSPDFHIGGRRMMLSTWDWNRPQSFGRVVRFWEHQMLSDGLLDSAAILDGILGTEVAASRRLDPEQRYMLRSFFASLMKRRMGVAGGSAVLGQGMPEWSVLQFKRPLLGLHPYHGIALAHKVPAVVLQLERRVGMDALVGAVAEFLARDTDEPATAEELFEVLETRTGEDLDTFFDDFFVNGYLPELSLVDVTSLPRRGGFRVTGAVQNKAEGEVYCPVVVRTDGPELRRTVVVPSKGRAQFTFDVDAQPQVAILDPDGLCLRLFGGGGQNAERVALQR